METTRQAPEPPVYAREASPEMPPAFVIKVDVDTHRGLREGAPRLLQLFSRHGVRASWFIAMGPDRTGRAVLRAFRQKGFVAKMFRSRASQLYPLDTMLRGTLLPSVQVAASQPHRLREIHNADQDLGIHGYDHVGWHDGLARMSFAEVEQSVTAAMTVFEKILHFKAAGFAAPGWQCTLQSLQVVDGLGFRYRSDTRGSFPYRPTIGSYVSEVPEIPTTLPTLDEVLGARGRSVTELTRFYMGEIQRERLNVHTVHAEIEGGPCLAHLDALLERVKDVLPFAGMGEVAASLLPVEKLPVLRVTPGRLPGRGGTVACQGAAPGTSR